MRRILFLIFALMPFFCSSLDAKKRKMPHRPIVSVSYFHGSQMYPVPDVKFTVKRDENGKITAQTYDQNRMRMVCYEIQDSTLLEQMADIIRSHKMYLYKKSYVDRSCLDGWAWSFRAEFTDSTSTWKTYDDDVISSGGSNAYPNDNGCKLIQKLFEKSLQTATFLYVCDEDGNKILDE